MNAITKTCLAAVLTCLAVVLAMTAGCGGDARVELAAADSLQRLAGELSLALDEYAADLRHADDVRERAVIDAFIARIRSADGDEARMARDTDAFVAALRRVHEDRRVEWRRHQASADNITALHELEEDLRELALQSLSLTDDMQRYFYVLLQTARNQRESIESEDANTGD